MAKPSKLLKCPHCGREIHARGWINHLGYKHSVPMETARQELKTGRKERKRYQTQNYGQTITMPEKYEGLDIQPKYQLSVRSEPTEVVKQKNNGVKTPSQTSAKPTRSDWKPLAVIVGVIWLLYETIPEVRDSLQRHWRGESYMKNWLGRSNESRFR